MFSNPLSLKKTALICHSCQLGSKDSPCGLFQATSMTPLNQRHAEVLAANWSQHAVAAGAARNLYINVHISPVCINQRSKQTKYPQRAYMSSKRTDRETQQRPNRILLSNKRTDLIGTANVSLFKLSERSQTQENLCMIPFV